MAEDLNDPRWTVPNPFAATLPFFFAQNAFVKEKDWWVEMDMEKEGVSVRLQCQESDPSKFFARVGFDNMMLLYANGRCVRSFLDEKVNGQDAYYMVDVDDSAAILERIGIKGFLDEISPPTSGAKRTPKSNARSRKSVS
jgi:hypothetical protein